VLCVSPAIGKRYAWPACVLCFVCVYVCVSVCVCVPMRLYTHVCEKVKSGGIRTSHERGSLDWREHQFIWFSLPATQLGCTYLLIFLLSKQRLEGRQISYLQRTGAGLSASVSAIECVPLSRVSACL